MRIRSTSTYSLVTRWALIASIAFVPTVILHELAHGIVGRIARPFTSNWPFYRALAGPVTSLLIVLLSILWLGARDRSSVHQRWVITLGFTSAARVLFVWLLATPFLLGSARVTFGELTVADGLGAPVGALLALETAFALAGAAGLGIRIPPEERREGLLGSAAGVVVAGLAVMMIDSLV